MERLAGPWPYLPTPFDRQVDWWTGAGRVQKCIKEAIPSCFVVAMVAPEFVGWLRRREDDDGKQASANDDSGKPDMDPSGGYAILSILLGLSWIFFSLRMYVRFFMMHQPSWDDLLVFLAVVRSRLRCLGPDIGIHTF